MQCLLLSLLYPAKYLFNTDLCELSISRYQGYFFLEKRMEYIFVYVLEYMLTLVILDKMQNIRNLRAEHLENYSSFSYCTHSTTYRLLLPSDRVIECIQLIIFRPSTTGTIPLTTQRIIDTCYG